MGESKNWGGLGFRDLESFNKAMLAKQIWRMLTNPDTLVAKMMRQKYYKNGNLLDAKMSTNLSMIWKSLWASMDLVKARSIWRVVNGRCIKI